MVLYHVDRPIEDPLGTMTSRPGNKRPSLTRAETIESCNSDDLVTVLEVHDRKPYKIMDRSREIKKGVMAESLAELIERGKEKLNYPMDKEVYVVLEEDGTEIDEEEYFQTLPENTLLMLLHVGDKWSPFGPPFTPPSSSKSRYTPEFDFCASSTSPDPKDLTNDENGRQAGGFKATQRHVSSELTNLLERLERNPGLTALLATHQLELLAEMDIDLLLLGTLSAQPSSFSHPNTQYFDQDFLHEIQTMAFQYLADKSEIRDAVGLLKLSHHYKPNESYPHPPLKEHREKREDRSKKSGLRPKKKVTASSCMSLANDIARNGTCSKNSGLNANVISLSTTVDNTSPVRMNRKKEEQI